MHNGISKKKMMRTWMMGLSHSQKQLSPPLFSQHNVMTVTDDTWNNVKNGNVNHQFFNENKELIAEVDYRVCYGQIGWMYVDSKYDQIEMRSRLFDVVVQKLQQKNISSVWEVTGLQDQPFWNQVPNCQYQERVHFSVTGSGYVCNLPNSAIKQT